MMKRKWLLPFCLTALALWAGIHIGQYKSKSVHADANSTVPRSYGVCRGSMGNDLLIFEDNYGTVRLVHPASGAVFGTVVRK